MVAFFKSATLPFLQPKSLVMPVVYKPAPVHFCTDFTSTANATVSTYGRDVPRGGTLLHAGYAAKLAFVRWEVMGMRRGPVGWVYEASSAESQKKFSPRSEDNDQRRTHLKYAMEYDRRYFKTKLIESFALWLKILSI
ncbi:hypothetical protein RF11_05081 [Thelohanellus kitauei]|uniref:Uncharacterized protein n=1 Tax=Thelohanellus kitauei TaxID=669202 RepID=A0A0C2NHV8_THEKT|nr:hypothetical protein RF11_05081 [Thelohanellus kitauei]